MTFACHCPAGGTAGQIAINGECAEKRDEHDRGRRQGAEPFRFMKRDRRLIGQRAEVIEAQQAHHPEPIVLDAVLFGTGDEIGQSGIF